MINLKAYPIIEFDDTSSVIVDVKKNITKDNLLPQNCVISFFGDAIKQFVKENSCGHIGSLIMETFELPIYEAVLGNDRVAILHGLGSGPYAAGQIEKLTAMGCKKFIVCGGCGVLEKGSQCGDIYVPTSAIRDEGTSYHYVAPNREIEINHSVKKLICSYLEKHNIPHRCVKTWTTDAMYRETVDIVELRRKEGCDIVEMECASFFAVAQYKEVSLGQILYAGDDLSGEKWDCRNWKSNFDARYNLLYLSVNLVVNL